jgi:DNA replication protein DnaC
MQITSDRNTSEWGAAFADAVVAAAILSRLLHHSRVITVRGDSYRRRAKRGNGLRQKATTPGPDGTVTP